MRRQTDLGLKANFWKTRSKLYLWCRPYTGFTTLTSSGTNLTMSLVFIIEWFTLGDAMTFEFMLIWFQEKVRTCPGVGFIASIEGPNGSDRKALPACRSVLCRLNMEGSHGPSRLVKPSLKLGHGWVLLTTENNGRELLIHAQMYSTSPSTSREREEFTCWGLLSCSLS